MLKIPLSCDKSSWVSCLYMKYTTYIKVTDTVIGMMVESNIDKKSEKCYQL